MDEAEVETTETYDNLSVGDFYEKLTAYRESLEPQEEDANTTEDATDEDSQSQEDTSSDGTQSDGAADSQDGEDTSAQSQDAENGGDTSDAGAEEEPAE